MEFLGVRNNLTIGCKRPVKANTRISTSIASGWRLSGIYSAWSRQSHSRSINRTCCTWY